MVAAWWLSTMTLPFPDFAARSPLPSPGANFGTAQVYQSQPRSLLMPASGFIGSYDFSLNPYQGCQYGCTYCYAATFSPNARWRDAWGDWVVVKANATTVLQKDLDRWFKSTDRPPHIYMSTSTDPYQPIEAKTRLTRDLLMTLLPYQPTLVIQTRSPLILRDIDLLQRFQRLRINVSIPTGSESVRRAFEGRSPSIAARFQILKRLRYGIAAYGDRETYLPKLSVTLTPLLPTEPADLPSLLQRLAIADRVVIQPFHPDRGNQMRVAATRPAATALKQQFAWWYDQESQNYESLKRQIQSLIHYNHPDLELLEGQAGFGYD